MLSASQEKGTLLLPLHRQWPLQPLQHHPLVRPPAEDRLDDVRRQQCQPQDPAHVALLIFSASAISSRSLCRWTGHRPVARRRQEARDYAEGVAKVTIEATKRQVEQAIERPKDVPKVERQLEEARRDSAAVGTPQPKPCRLSAPPR